MGTAYRSCKLSNLGSPSTALQLRKCGARSSIPKLFVRRRGTSLPPAFKPCCDYSCPNMHPTADPGLYPNARTGICLRKQRAVLEGSALGDGLGAGLQLAEDLQGARVIGRYYPGWHSIKRLAEMCVGFWHAPLLLQ
jgi:hypothetical protein